MPTLEESAAAAPAWWKKQSDGTSVPPTSVTQSLWSRSLEADIAAPAAGIVCALDSKVVSSDEHEVSRVRIEGAGTASVVDDSSLVFLPGLGSTGVRRIEAQHGRVHRMGVIDWFVGVVVIPLLPLMLHSEGYRPDGYLNGKVKGPPWKLSSKALALECRPVERADVEALVPDALAMSEKCYRRAPDDELPADPEPGCVAPVAGLLGWADPRTGAVLERIDAEAALAKGRRLKTHRADLEHARTAFGDFEVTQSELTCPAHGPCALTLKVKNGSPSARGWFFHPWHVRKQLVDDTGAQFEVELDTRADLVRAGASAVLSATLTPLGAAERPQPPLTLRLESTEVIAITAEPATCEVDAERARLTFPGETTRGFHFVPVIDTATGREEQAETTGDGSYTLDLYAAKKCPKIALLGARGVGVLRIPSPDDAH